jgi:outer membrane murein-binding lipoprotein Lpp
METHLDPFLAVTLAAFTAWLLVDGCRKLDNGLRYRSLPPNVRALNARIEALEHELEITRQREEQAKFQHNDEVRALKAGQMLMAAAAKSKPLVQIQPADPISDKDLRELRAANDIKDFLNGQLEEVNKQLTEQVAQLSERLGAAYGCREGTYTNCTCQRCFAVRMLIDHAKQRDQEHAPKAGRDRGVWHKIDEPIVTCECPECLERHGIKISRT